MGDRPRLNMGPRAGSVKQFQLVNGIVDDCRRHSNDRHRIRHYGLFANANRAENIATARALLHIVPPADPQKQPDITPDALRVLPCPCPCCGARMIVIEMFARAREPRWRPMPSTVDTS